MGKQWTHSLCDDCWKKVIPKREPHRLKDSQREHCCSCGVSHNSGIYWRSDPRHKILKCGGKH